MTSLQRSSCSKRRSFSNNIISHLMCSKCYADPEIVCSDYLHHASSLCVYETHSLHIWGHLQPKSSHLFQLWHDLWRNTLLSVIASCIVHLLWGEGGREGEEEKGRERRRKGGRGGGGRNREWGWKGERKIEEGLKLPQRIKTVKQAAIIPLIGIDAIINCLRVIWY